MPKNGVERNEEMLKIAPKRGFCFWGNLTSTSRKIKYNQEYGNN